MPDNEIPWTKKLYRKLNSYWASLTKEAVAWHVVALCLLIPLTVFVLNIIAWIIGSILSSGSPLTGFMFLMLAVGLVGAFTMSLLKD